MLDFAIAIVSGIISGIVVNKFYEFKNAVKERTKYFIELRNCIFNLIFECEQLYESDTCHETSREMYDTLRKIMSIYIPVDYKWLRLNKEEQEYVNEFESIYQKIKDNVSTIIFNYDEMNAAANNYNDQVEYRELLHNFITTINSCKRDLEQECLKFKGNYPILQKIMKKYKIK